MRDIFPTIVSELLSTGNIFRPNIEYIILIQIATILPIIISVYANSIFHWVDMFLSAVHLQKQKEMLAKIKPGFQTEVYIEEVMQRVRVASRMRIPFFIVFGLLFVISYGNMRTL
jgi:hypothetical protein